MKRPPKATVRKAIEDTAGNLSRAALLLGCSRASLYCWCYQLGLERFAGINTEGGIVATTKATTTSDLPVQATVRLPEALWRRVRIKAIEEGVTASDIVRKALEAAL